MKNLRRNPLTGVLQNPAVSRRGEGDFGERLALKFLEGKGYRLIERNYCIRGGEIDLILQKNGILVFAEVKTRHGTAFGHPAESLGTRKKIKLLHAVRTYLKEKSVRSAWRCDLVAISFRSPREADISIYKNIFTD
jgi:putative endonuclease